MTTPHKRRALVGLLTAAIASCVLLAVLGVPAIASPPARPAFTLTDSLESYWKLDATSGSTRTDSVGSNTLTVTGDGTAYAAGIVGNSGQWPDVTDMQHTDNASLSTGDIDFTFVAWFYMDQAVTDGQARMIVGKRSSSDFEYEIGLDNPAGAPPTSAYFTKRTTGNAETTVTSSATFSLNQWYFIVAWHDAVNDQLGIQINSGSPTTVSSSGGVKDSTLTFHIGNRDTANSTYEGRIDEVGFWKRVLTSTERGWLYNAGAGCTYPFTSCIPTPTPTPTIAINTIHLSPIVDATIREDTPNTNYGSSPYLTLGDAELSVFGSFNNRSRFVINFDWSEIPAGAQITAATLELTAITTANDARTVQGSMLRQSPAESSINWINSQSGVSWATLGAGAPGSSGSPSTTALVDTDLLILVPFNVQGDVELFSTCGVGNGWIFRDEMEAANQQIIFASSEYPTSEYRPDLIVSYIAAAGTPTPSSCGILPISENYIQGGSFESSSLPANAWDTQITDPSVRTLLGLGNPPQPGMDAVLWNGLAAHGAECGTNAAVIVANNPESDFRTGQLSQAFNWPGGSMYLSFLGKTAGDTKGDVSLWKEDDGTLIQADGSFSNPTTAWETARYVYNLNSGRYRLSFGANGIPGQFGWFAVDDVNVRSGWWLNSCEAPRAPGLVPPQPLPTLPTPLPYTPVPPTQWIHWATATPLGGGDENRYWPTVPYYSVGQTPIAPLPDYTAGANILRNASFESFFNFLYWLPSRLSQIQRIGGIENRAYVSLNTGTRPPAVSQHFDLRYGEPIYVSLWANTNSHFYVAIRDIQGNFRNVWRIDDTCLCGWNKYEWATGSLPAGEYSIEITNIYLLKAEIDEVAVTVGLPYAYPSYYPDIETNPTAEAEATNYINTVATLDAASLLTAAAQGTSYAHLVQTAAVVATSNSQTQAAATYTYNQGGTATAQSYGYTQTAIAAQQRAALTSTALWLQLAQAQTQGALTRVAQTQQSVAQAQTQAALQTQIVLTAQAAFAGMQTQIYLTSHAPAALTQTAQSIISTAQSPFYATQTAIAHIQTQIAATALGTPPEPSPTVDVVLATQQALVVPDQPEAYWAAICGRPPNALNLAWWLDYEVCRILSWFAWSPVNTTQVQTWQVEATYYEPGGMIDELVQSGNLALDIWNAFNWEDTGVCNDQTFTLGSIFVPAHNILLGQIEFEPGEPFELNCLIPLRPFLGDGIADGVCGAIGILCQHGIMIWLQFAFDGGMIYLFIVYIQRAWIAKATQG